MTNGGMAKLFFGHTTTLPLLLITSNVYLMETGRATLVGGPFPLLLPALAITAAAFILLLIGWAIFHITVPRIIERMGM